MFKPGNHKENIQSSSSCTQAAAKCARKSRTFFSLQMDIHLVRLCVEHNPYQLGKNQWAFILDDMNTTFNLNFLLRTLKERANKLVEKYKAEQLQYKTGTEEEHTELGELLEQVVGYIDASAVPISQQTNVDSPSEDEEEENNTVATPRVPAVTPRATTRKEKQTADTERDQLLNQTDMAPEPITLRRKRSALLPEDELIQRKQEQDYELQKIKEEHAYELELKRVKLEERKLELERERVELERENLRIREEDNKRRDVQQQQMNEVFKMLIKK